MPGFGNCTLDTCNVQASIFQYRPSLGANAAFIALFGIAFVFHLLQGLRWRTWTFMGLVLCGCASEMIGYGGRIMMSGNPWNFTGFMLQIGAKFLSWVQYLSRNSKRQYHGGANIPYTVCVAFAPVYFTAAIYITLYRTILYLSPASSRFAPKIYYIVFIPCDIISLVLQAIGGAKSTQTSGSSQSAIDIALAGLAFQVGTLCIFIALSLDFALRYRRDLQTGAVRTRNIPARFKIFVGFLTLSILCILVRCVYRIDELSNGYEGPLIHDQGLFIGLEGVMVIAAVFALNVGHPGQIFTEADVAPQSEDDIPSESMRIKHRDG
ncbi:hypothetical protein BP5796_06978 [Coleophoma crateriformis]|uniref:Parasitic phase-specific protein PSP-1 n=1 Tax=Coleophoma crateriformis TaxID=565419 RepID=A0A3D8RQ01_9HELO|nr:hypothetical protein BP5796_06978 [Coleophoma crateriformis]